MRERPPRFTWHAPRFLRGMKRRLPLVPILVLLLIALWITRALVEEPAPREVPYSEVAADVEAGRVQSAELRADRILVVLRGADGKAGETVAATRIPNMDERALLDAMEREHVVVTGKEQRSSWWSPLLWTLLPLLLLPILFLLAGNTLGGLGGLGGGKGRPMTFARSKAKLYDRRAEQAVTFDAVAGVQEEKADLV